MDKDFRIEDVARVMNTLTIGVGFGDGYVVQGGDIGSKVGRIMAAVHDECKAAHSKSCFILSRAVPGYARKLCHAHDAHHTPSK